MKQKLNIYLILITIFITPTIMGQDVVGTNVREEVTLFTDRDLYLSGENIWFNAFISVNNVSENRQLSNVLYIELFQNNRAIVKKKFQIVDGKVEGMLAIPEEIHSANYYLRAYTQYQRNFPPETFFTSLLTIINPEIPVRKSKTRPVKLVEIIPECGQILSGLPAKIAVKLNANLLEIVEKSLLTDQHQNTIDSVQFVENGLALIEFTPNDSLAYFLTFITNTGDTLTEPLSKNSSLGIIISENWKNNKVNFYSNQTYRLSNSPAHWLVLYSIDGVKEFEMAIEIKKAEQTIAFDAGKLEPGLYSLVLKNEEGKVITFTTFYKPSEKSETVKLSTSKNVFNQREAVQLTLHSQFKNEYENSCISLAVVKKGTAFSSNHSLPVFIVENPLLLPIFDNRLNLTDTSINRQITAALILNRYFFNSQIIGYQSGNNNTKKSDWLPETRDVSLSGIIRNTRTGQVLPNIWVYASVLGTDAQFHAYKSREDGSFIFSLNQLNNSHNLSLTIDSIPGIEAEFLIYNDFSDNWPATQDIPLQIDSSQQLVLESMFVNYQVAQMFKKKEQLSEQSADTLPFPFTDLQASISLKDFVALPTMPEVLNELVPYVNVRKRKGEHVLAVVDQTRKNVYDHPLILVDNLPVFNVDEILAINPAKIERIDVIGKVYSFGDLLIEGIVMFHTKTDNFAGIQLPSASIFVEYQTITPSAAVQFPVYNPQNRTPGHSPDFKNLLYWNPNVQISGNDTTITFYTADEVTKYEIIVSGKTADGRPVFGRHEIRVK